MSDDLHSLSGAYVLDALDEGERADFEEHLDIDLAYGRLRGGPNASHLDVVNALGERYGDRVDVMSLDDAGSVARYEALHGVDVLVELTPGRYANAQMAAFGEYCDTQRFRDRALETLTR